MVMIVILLPDWLIRKICDVPLLVSLLDKAAYEIDTIKVIIFVDKRHK